ncbi:hypothetical protein BCR36DRAFT_578898 [Piromyces finnis]|uniref:Uncharacterized protein n=1 Tax=Piromyces finnis TaxID=1754191 RepID=A0A1Y1VN36_9FUNG|nr:hypothetical protein BCR36DRAFT_578898 [Piromyces finnis]|eukprot:ORX60825.1 hypothetical protein BCR36DRAFT_578898 [Piromyces finnis]
MTVKTSKGKRGRTTGSSQSKKEERNQEISEEIKEKNNIYLQKWSIIFSLSLFFILISIFLIVVENNSISGYKIYAHQQYKRSLSTLQKSVNNFSSIIKQSSNEFHVRKRRSDLISNEDSENFKLTYPYQPLVLALDSIQEITWDAADMLDSEKMDIILKDISGSREEEIIAKNIPITLKKFKINLDNKVKSGTYNLIFIEKKENNDIYMCSSPEILILDMNKNDKNYYPKLLKFTYPYALLEWRINDNSIVTWNPLPFTKFSTTFKLSICELISNDDGLDISETLIHPEVQASNGYIKVNLKNIRGISSGKQYFFKASFLSGIFEMSSLFTTVDDTLEITNYAKPIQIVAPFTSTIWKINETVNISLNIKRYIQDNIGSTYLRLSYVNLESNTNNFDSTFITQFRMTKRKNIGKNVTIKIKDIKSIEDSQIIWRVPVNIKIGYYSIQIIKTNENGIESIIDQTSPIIEIIP